MLNYPSLPDLIPPTVLILPERRAAVLSLNLLAAVEVPLVLYDTDNIIWLCHIRCASRVGYDGGGLARRKRKGRRRKE